MNSSEAHCKQPFFNMRYPAAEYRPSYMIAAFLSLFVPPVQRHLVISLSGQ